MGHRLLVSPVVHSLWKTCEGSLRLCPDEQFLTECSYLEEIIPKIGYNPRGGRAQAGAGLKLQEEDLKSQGLPEDVIQAVYKVIRLNCVDYEVCQAYQPFTPGNLTACS